VPLRQFGSADGHHGSGGRWHDSAIEVFACDFPILAGDVETACWPPHPGLFCPEQVDGLAEWWTAAVEELRRPRRRRQRRADRVD